MSDITFFDQQGNPFAVPQERVGEMVQAGYTPAAGQTVTVADTGGKVPLETFIEIGQRHGAMPRLETGREAFQRGAEERFGGLGGAALAGAYGAGQGALFGLPGKALIETGAVAPETLAQLEEAQPVARLGGELLGAGAMGLATGGFGELGEGASLAARAGRTAAREAALGGLYGAGSEETQAAIEKRAARPLEAATGGALIGGAVGGAIPYLGRAAERMGLKAAEAEADVAARAATPDPLTSAQQARNAATQAVHDEVTSLFDKAAPIFEEQNAIADELERLGVSGNLSKSIASTRKSIETLQEHATKIAGKIEDADALEFWNRQSEDAAKAIAKTKAETAKSLQQAQYDLLKATERRAALKDANAALRQLDAADARVERLTNKVTNLQRLGELSDALGERVAEQDGVAATIRGVEAERADLMGQHLGENARAAAENAQQRFAARSRASLEEQAALEHIGIHQSTPEGQVMARAMMEAAEDPARLRTTLMDAVALERGGAKGLVHDILRQPGVIEALDDPHSISLATKLLEQGRETLGVMRPERATVHREVHEASREAWDALIKRYNKKLYDVALPTEAKAALASADEDARRLLAGRMAKTPERLQQIFEAHQTSLKPLATQVEETLAKRMTPDEFQAMIEERALDAARGSRIKMLDEQLEELGKKNLAAQNLVFEAQQALARAPKEMRASKLQDDLARAVASKKVLEETLQEGMAAREHLATAARNKATTAAEQRTVIAEQRMAQLNADQAVANMKRLNSVLKSERDLENVTRVLESKKTFLGTLEGLKVFADANTAALEQLRSDGLQWRKMAALGGTSNKLVPAGREIVENAKLRAFWKTAEGQSIKDALEAAKVKVPAEDMRTLGSILGVEALSGIFGHGLQSTILGSIIGSKVATIGARRAAEAIMNPIRWYGALNRSLDALAKAGPIAGKLINVHTGYTFSPKEASAYVDSILRDRADIEHAFQEVEGAYTTNSANIAQAKQRFIDAANYLEKKRPPNGITNGSDANAFARSVAILRNPDLLAKFVKDGTVRPQDVEVMRIVSPEAADQLSKAVALLHQENPTAAFPLLAPFGIKSGGKTKQSLRISMAFAQALSTGAMQTEGPMTPKAEVRAAAGRPPAQSSIAENSAADAGFGRD